MSFKGLLPEGSRVADSNTRGGANTHSGGSAHPTPTLRHSLSPSTGGSAATRKVMVAQPQYLPRVSHMAMVDQADLLVLLDTVDVNRQSWQTRAQVRARDGSTVLLSVPVHAHMGQPLCEVQVDNGRPWRRKHQRTLEAAYSHLPGWDQVAFVADLIGVSHLMEAGTLLTSLNHMLILRLRKELGITTEIVLASELEPTRDGKVERLEDLLTMTQATSYLCSRGSTYLEGQTHIGSVPIEWFDYEHPEYTQQGHPDFVSHLSVLDLIANCGGNSLAVLRGE